MLLSSSHLRTTRRRHHSRAGVSLIELLLTATVFTIGIGAVASSMVASRSLGNTVRETNRALEVGQSAVESVKGEVFEEAFVRFNATAADDPALGDSPGNFFAARGLNLQVGDADGFVGEILFPGDGVQLREDFVDPELGMPRDLNGDGVVDAVDHSGDYNVLPIRVRLQWTGETGARSLDFVTLLAQP